MEKKDNLKKMTSMEQELKNLFLDFFDRAAGTDLRTSLSCGADGTFYVDVFKEDRRLIDFESRSVKQAFSKAGDFARECSMVEGWLKKHPYYQKDKHPNHQIVDDLPF